MKIALSDVYDIHKGLENLMEKELPIKVAFLIQKNMKLISDELKISDDVRKQLVDKYKDCAEKVFEDGSFKLSTENKIEFDREMDELMGQDVSLELEKLKLDDLGDRIEPRTLFLLNKIIEED